VSKEDYFWKLISKPRPRVKTRGIGVHRIYSIHPRDKSRGFLRGGVNQYGQEVKLLNAKYSLIITDKGVVRVELIEKLKESLKKEKIRIEKVEPIPLPFAKREVLQSSWASYPSQRFKITNSKFKIQNSRSKIRYYYHQSQAKAPPCQ